MKPKVLMLIFFDAALEKLVVGIGKTMESVLEGKVLLESEVLRSVALLLVVTGRLLEVVLAPPFPERLELPEVEAFKIGKPFCAHFVMKSDKKERIRR